MEIIKYLPLVLMQFTLILGSPFLTQKCYLWDARCLTSTAQTLVPSLTAGIPELGVERLDTMYIDSLHVDQEGYKVDWYNIYLQGLRNTVIDNLSIDINSKVMRLLFHTDVSVKAHYVKKGYLLSLPVAGEGEVNMKLKNVHMEFVVPFDIIKDVQGRHIIDLKGYQYWYDVKDGVDVVFGNLYYGNNELSRKFHTLVQQNWKLLTIKYNRFLFDKSNDKIFNAIRNYVHSVPLDSVLLYYYKIPDTEIAVKCALNDSVCLTQQAQNTLQLFVEGIPELGIKKIDKLYIDDVIVQIPKFSYAWVNITIAGMRNAIIDKVSINQDLKYIRVLFHTTMIMEFDYICDGILMSLFYIFGDGKGHVTLKDMQMEILFVYDIIKDHNGKHIMDLKTYYYGFDPVGGVDYYFTNLFNGETERTKLLLDLMNESWRIIVAYFSGYFNKKITDKFFTTLQIYMRSRPLQEYALY
ncbi:uncharacterized protein LOC112043106 [Bicyclus anynana]|uniref:Uncharacterized protein LOC112043106 n=1 Tax=Bicyclus anynana TaxID=110368 RepID=A0A6J1MMX7_BICAN|nr:uncharacterized protein LOC112043106 [Bicyclus anynana]